MVKKYVIPGLIGLTLIVGFNWFFTHSYIDIKVAGSSNSGDLKYEIVNEAGKTTTVDDESLNLKKIVPKGTYRIKIAQGDTSYQAVATTNAFLKTSNINAEMKPQIARRFVGDNPSPCMNFIDNRLITGECGGPFQDLKIHIPATADQPTYVDTIPYGRIIGSSEGVVTTAQNTTVLVQENNDEERKYGQVLLQLNGAGGIVSRRDLAELDASELYTLQPYNQGFLIHNQSMSKALYYPTFAAQAQELKIEKPIKNDFQPLQLTTNGDSIVVTYAATGSIANTDGEGNTPPQGDSEILVVNDKKQSHYTFLNIVPSTTLACGTAKLCLVHDKTLTVYDISGAKAKLLFNIPGVTDIQNSSHGLLLVSDKEVSSLDIDTRVGFIEYSFGEYRFCGIQPAIDSYIVCLLTPRNYKIAVRLDQKANDTDTIDKKVLELSKLPQITATSAYGNYIYVTPEYGAAGYIPEQRVYGYNPTVKKSVDEAIRNAITKSGIKTPYDVINTGL